MRVDIASRNGGKILLNIRRNTGAKKGLVGAVFLALIFVFLRETKIFLFPQNLKKNLSKMFVCGCYIKITKSKSILFFNLNLLNQNFRPK